MYSLERLCRRVLCSAAMDEGISCYGRIISSVSYSYFLRSSHTLLFLYSTLFSTREKEGEVRSKIVLDRTTEVHVSDLGGPCLTFFFKQLFKF